MCLCVPLLQLDVHSSIRSKPRTPNLKELYEYALRLLKDVSTTEQIEEIV